MCCPRRPLPLRPASCLRPRPLLCCLAAGLGLWLALASAAPAQDAEPQKVRLLVAGPSRLRQSVTESWGSFDFTLTNFTDQDRLARVLIFYEGQEDVQYGRDVWVPARSTLISWALVGPAGAQAGEMRREIRSRLYDRTGG